LKLADRVTGTWLGRALCAAFAWTVLGWLFSLPGLSAMNWHRVLIMSLAQWWSWGLIAPLIVAIDQRLPFGEKQLWQRLLAQLVPSVLLTMLYLYVFAFVRALLGVDRWSNVLRPEIVSTALHGMFLWSWLVFWLIFGGAQIIRYYRHYLSHELHMERLERSFSEARLHALQLQLHPHFLFNALNTISSQVDRDPRLARRMIEQLGDLLRLSLDSRDRKEVPLAEELEFLDHYLAIQKIRFGSALAVEMDIAPEVKYASVPSLFLQPLVENAIRHGISGRASGGTISVTARGVGMHLEIQVQDDGVGLPEGWTMEGSTGLGLSVTRERIAGLHPVGESRFAVVRRPIGGTSVDISFPLRLYGKDQDHVPV
jgi:two-component system LytT family sensor kinase